MKPKKKCELHALAITANPTPKERKKKKRFFLENSPAVGIYSVSCTCGEIGAL